MRIGIIGSGRIGGNAGKLFARAGHEVLFSFSRDRAKLEALAEEAGNGARAGTPEEAARFGEVVMLSVPWALVGEALEAAGPLDGKIVIDTTNQFGRDEAGNFGVLNLPEGLSAAAYNSRRAEGSRLVKAYNTMTAGFQAEAAGRTGPDRVVMFYAGDDEEANRVVAGLIEDSGFDPVYVGSLAGDVVWMEPPVARARCTGRSSICRRRARRLPGSRAAGQGVVHDPVQHLPSSPSRGSIAVGAPSNPDPVATRDPAEERDSSLFVRPQEMRNLTSEQRTEERASTWLELFFDLCFVVAVAALARGLHDEPNLGGMLRFLGLFVPVWWSWMIFTWYATSFDNDDVPYRITLFVAMLSILGLAASVGGIGVDAAASVGFVLAYTLMRLLVAGLFVRARRHVPVPLRPFVGFYVAGNLLGAAIWLSSLLVPPPLRYGVWAVGLCVELLGPILAVRTLDNPRVTFHPRHIAERYGLFTLIVLGESVLAVASGTAGTDWAPEAMLTAIVGFVAAACIWWLYFDHVGSSGIELGPRPAFYWGYGHFAVYAGIAAFGVGVQLAIEAAAPEYALAAGAAPHEGYGLGARTVLAGGVILFLLGIAFVDRINEGTTNDRVLLARLGAVALLVLVTALGSPLSSPAFAATVCLVLLALTAFETIGKDPPAEPTAL